METLNWNLNGDSEKFRFVWGSPENLVAPDTRTFLIKIFKTAFI